jgi:hypothetical protein
MILPSGAAARHVIECMSSSTVVWSRFYLAKSSRIVEVIVLHQYIGRIHLGLDIPSTYASMLPFRGGRDGGG